MDMPTMPELISFIETKNNRAAVRFEPATYNKFGDVGALKNAEAQKIIARIQIINRCSVHTAAMIYSSSWGAHQLMGFNIYADQEFDIPVGEFLACDTIQLKAFMSFLNRNALQNYTAAGLAANHPQRLKFSIRYNGSIAYEQPMIAALKHFGVAIS